MKRFLFCTAMLLAASFAQAGETKYIYDDAGRLTGVRYVGVAATSYVLDPMGNLICAGDDCDIYVESSKSCGNKKPCFGSFGRGVNAAGTGATLNIASDSPFAEDISVDSDTNLRIEGGWLPDFSGKNGENTMTILQGSLTVSDGAVVVVGISIEGNQGP